VLYADKTDYVIEDVYGDASYIADASTGEDIDGPPAQPDVVDHAYHFHLQSGGAWKVVDSGPARL
jgi:hypothetical protein